MKLFITGATGFVGSHLVRAALGLGHEVFAIRRPGSHPRVALPSEPTWLDGDLENFDATVVSGCHAMIHAAAHSANTPYDSLSACIRWNVTAALRAIRRTHAVGVKNFVFVGSCFEYGHSGDRLLAIPSDAPLHPVGSYPISKAMASLALLEYAREQRLGASLARLFHVYGEGEPADRFWPGLVRAAANGADFFMSDGTQVRDFIPAPTAAALLLAEAERLVGLSHPEQTVINIGTGHGQRLVDFAIAEWRRLGGTGTLYPGSHPRKAHEIERLVPDLTRRSWPIGAVQSCSPTRTT